MFELIVVAVLVLLAIVAVVSAVKAVPQGYNWTVERWGKYSRTISPGLQILIPVMERVGNKQNMMEQVLDIIPQDVISSDNASVMTDAVCFYQILDAARASYRVSNLVGALQNLVTTNIRAVLGSMELDEILSNRDSINTRLLAKVDEASDAWGIKVTRIEIRDVSPPADLVQAMARQMKAEREKRAQILEAEGQRAAAITVAEGEKAAEILRAEGALQASMREAEARERLAEAEAKATQVVSSAISHGDPRAINYFVAQKYVDTLGKLAASNNNKVMMIPLEASSVIGSIAGISEIAKSIAVSKSDS